MPLITGTIDRDGACINVLIGVSRNREAQLRRHKLAVPERVPVRLVIDTGSFVTGLLPAVFLSLGIPRYKRIPVRTPSTQPGQPHEADQYDVSITLVAGMGQTIIPSVHAIASDDFDAEEGVQGILGRDVLDRCVFQYFGPHGQFTLAY